MNVFVYGTLKRGFNNHRFVAGTRYVGKVAVQGFTLLYAGYPAAKDGTDTDFVVGEVYDIGDPETSIEAKETLQNLDWLESEGKSYDRRVVKHPSFPEGLSMYVACKDSFKNCKQMDPITIPLLEECSFYTWPE